MSDFSSLTPAGHGPVGPISRIGGVTSSPASREVAVKPLRGDQRADDTVELSTVARYMDALRQLRQNHQARVAQVQQQVAADTYETDDKLDTAIDRLVEDLGL
jgi:hypothetical protein